MNRGRSDCIALWKYSDSLLESLFNMSSLVESRLMDELKLWVILYAVESSG